MFVCVGLCVYVCVCVRVQVYGILPALLCFCVYFRDFKSVCVRVLFYACKCL